ncbi:hypothetical protein [Cyanobacterium aponinum]|uniref:hypothetical protein n=1 Tax=Cyanobacterium aponinum TaxID=379064 RepID=UPI00105679D1|nr:hypothetical protein [Cyanobacterium aponinum]
MSKDENVMRVDVRVPLNMYERIEILAEKTNQPFTPKTKNTDNPKRVVTPIILKLVELGLGVIEEDSSKLIEDLVTPEIDNSETIENRIFERLEKRLDSKLDELIGDKLGLFETRLKEITEAQLTAVTITPENENKESAIEPNETIEVITPEVVNEVKVSALEVMSEGLSSGKLAQRFKTNKKQGEGASKTTINTNKTKLSQEEFINWSKEQDPDGIGWYLNETDKKFYPL